MGNFEKNHHKKTTVEQMQQYVQTNFHDLLKHVTNFVNTYCYNYDTIYLKK